MRAYQRSFALLAFALTLGLAACGSGSAATGQTPATTAPSGHCPATSGLPANVSDHGAVSASGSTVTIEANDFFFTPTCVTGVPGGTVTLTVHNVGQTLHNVSIPSLNIDIDVSPGQTITFQVRMGNAPLVFFCKYHKGVGMYGALLPSKTSHRCCCCRESVPGYVTVATV